MKGFRRGLLGVLYKVFVGGSRVCDHSIGLL